MTRSAKPNPLPTSPRRCFGWLAIVLCGLAAAAWSSAAPPLVVRFEIDSAIQPVAAGFLVDSIEAADRLGAELVVVELDTPGGLLTSMREMTTAILGAQTPVAVFVSPRGAQAASAGFFLLMAADIAAMAPGTNTGAASPVTGQGEDVGETMKAKVTEDTAALIRSLAERSGRNVDLAESAVTEAKSFSAEEALENELIDLVAEDFDALLAALDGREVRRGDAEPIVLAVADAEVRAVEPTWAQKILSIVADPTIAYLLLSLGGLGLMLELYNPGAILPGVVGAICIVLGFFGLSVLPVSAAGVALIALALMFYLLEIKVQSFGMLALAGTVCLAFGGLMLIKSPEPALRVSRQVILLLGLSMLVAVAGIAYLVARAYRQPVATGEEGLLHERGEARSALDPSGKVFVHGELWNAVADHPIPAGTPVEIIGVDRLTLRVRRAGEADPA